MIKMSGRLFFVGAALAAAFAGCSSSSGSSAVVGSAEGESCSRTADCSGSLVCIQDTCVPKGSTAIDAGVVVTPDGAVIIPDEAGGGGTDASAPVAVPEAAPPRLSAVGQSCLVASDCDQGLVCTASGLGDGVCDLASYGLTPSGKTCSGECNSAADCCELPLGVVIGGQAIHTCQDLLNLTLSGNTTQCTAASPPAAASAVGVGCFYYATYCSTCASNNIWSCTNNQCVYSHACQNSGNVLNGCPSETRTGRATPTTNCDTASSTCKAPAVIGECTMDSDCDGKTTTDSDEVCRGGDCTCYELGCYFKCSVDLDCEQGYHCDATGTKLCTANAACSTDADCAATLDVANAKCDKGTCKLPCTTDHDCGYSGVVHGYALGDFSGTVCGADGFCDPLGCSSDADCENGATNPGGSDVHLFCVTPVVMTAPPELASAITN